MKSMEIKSLLAFDMDGVLVDVSGSYRETVRMSARSFFKGARAWEALPEPLFPLEDLSEVKRRGGLNNDWDLTFRIISMLMEGVSRPAANRPLPDNPWDLYRAEVLTWDVRPLGEILSRGPGALLSLGGSGEPENSYTELFYRGGVQDGNVIKRIFQEIYLGDDLFLSTYGTGPRFHHGGGCIFSERPLVSTSILSRLHARHFMAIATGRPGREASFALETHEFSRFFDLVLTLDDCIAEERSRGLSGRGSESLSKPDPFMLDAIAGRLPTSHGRLYYVGDMPDDMYAASRSAYGFTPVGVTGRGRDSEAAAKVLREAGAMFLIGGVEELEGIIPKP